jgi:hypothetical protein
MIPLINNLNPKPTYNGFQVSLGETPEHLSFRLRLVKPKRKKIPIVLIGASTPSQIFEELVKLNTSLTDCVFIHAGHGAQDVNDYLNLASPGWQTINSAIPAAGFTFSDIKWIITCQEDLKSDSNVFPDAPLALKDLEISLINLFKSKFPNLKVIDIFSRLNAHTIDPVAYKQFVSPSDYNNCFSAKWVVESTFATNHLLNGVWVTDAPSMWTDGETVRSDGFAIKYSWFKTDGSPHLALGEGRTYLANWLFNYCKRYAEFK